MDQGNRMMMVCDVQIESSWKQQLQEAFNEPSFKQLVAYVKQAYQQATIYPAAGHIFRAFALSPFDQTKVVILGQDPYHGKGQAEGLAFSVPDGMALPPSLRNIFLERQTDLGIPLPASGSLVHWAKQGILLLNATLTVQAHRAGSHQNQGWEDFTDAVIQKIAAHKRHVVFLLWGSYAQKKAAWINPTQHLVIQAAHPSPLSAHRGFFGHQPFSQTNRYLEKTGQTMIAW